MKKRISLVLALMILLSLCSFARAEKEPLHIEFWHTRGSGANYEVLKNSVDTFNATIGKEKGIFRRRNLPGRLRRYCAQAGNGLSVRRHARRGRYQRRARLHPVG